MVEGKGFLVDVMESTVRGIWKSLEQGGSSRLNTVSRLTWPWEERCGEQERKTRKCLQGRPRERGAREHKAETAGLWDGKGAGAGEV